MLTWPIAYLTQDGEPPAPLSTMPASGVTAVETMAVSFLSRWVGLSLGTEQVFLRPSARRERPDMRWSVLWGYGAVCGLCGAVCRCENVYSLQIPGPVASTVTVTIDGTELPQTAFRIDNRNLLVRQDGDHWPKYENVRTVDGDQGSWSISYEIGTPVPVGGQIAAGVLATELAKMLVGDASCQLPKRLQALTRQGVTLETVYDNFATLKQGLTGIWAIDSWVTSMTQSISVARPKVYSPDVPWARRTTTDGSTNPPIVIDGGRF